MQFMRLFIESNMTKGGGSFLKDGDTVQVRDATPRSTATSTRNAP